MERDSTLGRKIFIKQGMLLFFILLGFCNAVLLLCVCFLTHLIHSRKIDEVGLSHYASFIEAGGGKGAMGGGSKAVIVR